MSYCETIASSLDTLVMHSILLVMCWLVRLIQGLAALLTHQITKALLLSRRLIETQENREESGSEWVITTVSGDYHDEYDTYLTHRFTLQDAQIWLVTNYHD